MYPTHQFKDKFVLFLKIFFPILIYQFANYSASFVDTTMTGQYNTMDLAGVSTATSLWNPFFTFLTGIVSAMVPIIGHHLGRGKKEEVASDFYQFIYLAFGLSLILLGIVIFFAPPVLNHIGLEIKWQLFRFLIFGTCLSELFPCCFSVLFDRYLIHWA